MLKFEFPTKGLQIHIWTLVRWTFWEETSLQMWCLLRHLPILIGDQVPANDVYWEFLLELCYIGNILFTQMWSKGLSEQYGELYTGHLEKLKLLFPDARLLPKHHFLTHYGTFALNSGPPYKSMVACQVIYNVYCHVRSHHVTSFHCHENVCNACCDQMELHDLPSASSMSKFQVSPHWHLIEKPF